MREKIERVTCDQCGVIHDLSVDSFGGRAAPWFMLFVPDSRNRTTDEKNFCGLDCAIAWLLAKRKLKQDLGQA